MNAVGPSPRHENQEGLTTLNSGRTRVSIKPRAVHLARQLDDLGYVDKHFSEKPVAEIVAQTRHRLSKRWHPLRCQLTAWKGAQYSFQSIG